MDRVLEPTDSANMVYNIYCFHHILIIIICILRIIFTTGDENETRLDKAVCDIFVGHRDLSERALHV